MMSEASNVRTLEVSIVLHVSDLETLRATLQSLIASASAALDSSRLEHVSTQLVDNASGDVYRAALRELLLTVRETHIVATAPDDRLQIELTCLDANGGFGAGHNAALLGSEADALLVLNPDVVLEPDAISKAVAFLDSTPAAVALNPASTGSDGFREYLCKRYPSVLDLLLRGFGGSALRAHFSRRLARYEYRDLPMDSASRVEILSGACLLCRRTAFDYLEGFDERYFLYFEDFDLSRRLSGRGDLYFCPQMKITHLGGQAARKGPRHIAWFVRSALRFFSSHGWKLS